MQKNNDKTLDDKGICWCSGYDAFYDGYSLGCMDKIYTPTQNKNYVMGWLAAQKESNKIYE